MSAATPSGFSRYEAGDRVIAYAVLASIVLHGVLLFAVHLRPGKGRPAPLPPIVAHLAPAPTPSPPAAKPELPRPRAEQPPPPPVVKPVPKPTPTPAPKAAPPPKPAPPPAPVQAAPPLPNPQPAAPAAQSAPPVAAVAPQAPAAAQGSAEADSLQAYRSELIEMAKRYKRYPRVAMDNNWEGRVVVRIAIGANGMVSSIQIVTSAGHEVLDKQAREMLERAKPRVQIPPALRGKAFTVEIPVTYELKEAG